MHRRSVQRGVCGIGANPFGRAQHQMLLRAHLEVEARAAVPIDDPALLIHVEGWIRTVEGNRRRFPLALVVDEVVCPVAANRTAVGAVEPLIRIAVSYTHLTL